MSVLLLQLAGPLQAWGESSRFNSRYTRQEPTKSGVIGMLACAQGRQRDDDITDLLKLEFGVRADQRGSLVRDYQTEHASSFQRERAKRTRSEGDLPEMPITYRYYISDALFVVALSAQDQGVLETLEHALDNPVWPLFLGRRSCPPAGRVVIGIRDDYDNVKDALTREPWHAQPWYKSRMCRRNHLEKSKGIQLEMVRDAEDEETQYFQQDVPVTFNPVHRRYSARGVVHSLVTVPYDETTPISNNEDSVPLFSSPDGYDPMSF